MSLRIRRGSNEQRLPITFEPGELIWVNQAATGTPYKLYVGNAGTPGGIDILQSSVGNKLRYNTVNGKIDLDLTTGNRLNTDDIIQLGGATNKFFTNELAQDAVGAMFAAGTMSGITFVYDDVANKMNVTVTGGGGGTGSGIAALVNDPSPRLGGTFDINSHNITGVGNINITGYATFTGLLTAPAGMNSNLPLNGFDINGEGNISIGGNAAFTGTLISQTGLGSDLSLNGYNLTGLGDINVSGLLSVNGLGSDLSLNGYNLTGSGNIDTTGTLSASSGLGANLSLNEYDLVGTGNVNITGNITGSGTITATTGLGANLPLNSHNITGSGNIDITGGLSVRLTNNIELRQVVDGITSKGFITTTVHRGTFSSPIAVQAGDELGGLLIKGHTNSATLGIAGIISVITDDTAVIAGGTFIKSKIVLSAATDISQNPTNAFILDSAGIVTVNTVSVSDGSASSPSIRFSTDGGLDSGLFHPADGIVCVAVNAAEKVRIDSGGLRVEGFMKVKNVNGTLPSPPEAGMIVLDGTTFKGYNGSAWVNLN